MLLSFYQLLLHLGIAIKVVKKNNNKVLPNLPTSVGY
jgi:hypothetical protein